MRLFLLFAVALFLPVALAAETKTATFSMYCYWTGEATLGKDPGVIESKIGHLGGSEIVQVKYNSSKTSEAELVRRLKRQNSFYAIKRSKKQPRFIASKHSLRTQYKAIYYLDLNEKQAIKLNSWAYFGGPMPQVLTPEQRKLLPLIKKKLGLGKPKLKPKRVGAGLKKYRLELAHWLAS